MSILSISHSVRQISVRITIHKSAADAFPYLAGFARFTHYCLQFQGIAFNNWIFPLRIDVLREGTVSANVRKVRRNASVDQPLMINGASSVQDVAKELDALADVVVG
ncbi:MAG: hypothetical protein K8R46_11480, partial [Pirellulales bacterium]|nr:hypothetical protein [Pirellulales bacterium]